MVRRQRVLERDGLFRLAPHTDWNWFHELSAKRIEPTILPNHWLDRAP